MARRSQARTVAGAVLWLGLGVGLVMDTQTPAAIGQASATTGRARGTFEVKLVPQGTPDAAEGSTLGRMSLDKQFQGDLVGVGKGEMLTALTETKGSAGYVAIERITGTLHGRRGAFVLQHSGTMTKGAPALSITVVPDSGSGELVGLTGRMTVDTSAGHAYDFEYALPPR